MTHLCPLEAIRAAGEWMGENIKWIEFTSMQNLSSTSTKKYQVGGGSRYVLIFMFGTIWFGLVSWLIWGVGVIFVNFIKFESCNLLNLSTFLPLGIQL